MGRSVLVLLCLGSVASADIVGGTTTTVQPDPDDTVAGGQLGGWLAYQADVLYVGGELAFETYTASPGTDFSVSYHALVGVRSSRDAVVEVAADVGAGVSQQIDSHLAILGGESGSETESVAASGAVRGHLAFWLGTVGTKRLGLGITTDARSTLDGDAGFGVGLGVFVAERPAP